MPPSEVQPVLEAEDHLIVRRYGEVLRELVLDPTRDYQPMG